LQSWTQEVRRYATLFTEYLPLISVNLPKAEAIIARLIVLAGLPQNGRHRGEHVLRVMGALVPNLHPGLVELWDEGIERLICRLEGKHHKNTTKLISFPLSCPF